MIRPGNQPFGGLRGARNTVQHIEGETSSLAIAESEIRAQLAAILRSEQFASARKLSAFLEFAVSSALAGADVKEALIGVEVYGREATYNPKTDSIVRAEATRLRAKLREYYEGPGRDDPVLIDLPKGSYVPAFQLRLPAPPPPEPAAETRTPRRIPRVWLALPVGLVLAAGAWWARPGLFPAPSIAVMPIRGAGPDPGIKIVADSLTSHLIKALLASRPWKVVGQTPTLDLTGDNRMLAPLRKDFHADAVLTGSISGTGGRDAKLVLELINVADGYMLWRETVDRPLQNMADTQAELARRAVESLTQRYTGRPTSPANAAYAQAREFWSSYTTSGLAQSIPYFEQATREDPKHAAAWAGLADASQRLADDASDIDTRDRVERARKAAEKALSLDESNAEAHYVLGRIYLYKDWNFRAGVEQFHRAVALDPSRVGPRISYAQALTIVRDLEGALRVIREGLAHLPVLGDLLMQEGSIYFLARKFERMEEAGREMLTLDAENPSAYWLTGLSLELRGKLDEAIREFETGLRIAARDDLRILCALSHAYGSRGDRKRSIETLRRILPDPAKPPTRFTLCYCAALTHVSLGERDAAFEWLGKARQIHDQSFPFLLSDARFDPIRSDARYTDLVKPVTDHLR